MSTNEKPIIGITTGDLNGIGPELIIKVFSDNRMMELCTPVVFSSQQVINYYRKLLKDYPINFIHTRDLSSLQQKQLNIFTCWEEEVSIQPGVLTDTGGKYAVRSLMVAGQCLKDKQIDALVTAPMHKANTRVADFPFTGHTPYLQHLFSEKDVLMLLYQDALRVALVTEHLPIADVAATVTKERIISKYNLLQEALIKDFGIAKPRIAMMGLNPHAGDEGQIGDTEEKIIIPAIDLLKRSGALVFGPYSADAFFARSSYKQFDGVLAMYHDQGLVPFKMLADGGGVNFSAGLPAIRTSPDHGTAFDIAGKNLADAGSFREAIFQSINLLRQRRNYLEYTANPLKQAKRDRDNNKNLTPDER